MEFQIFEEQLKQSIFQPIASFVAWTLPITEIVVAIILLTPNWRLLGLYLSSILMAAFTVYVIGLVSFAHELPCSCGGVLQELTWPQHIIFNSVFLVLAIWGISLYKRSSKDNQFEKTIVHA
jgi:uncharacterized membrane protein YphA (DoxX/SURF4 family)